MRSDNGGGTRGLHDSRAGGAVAAFAVYTLIAAAVTWPLVRDMRTRVASDTGDPILNASILVWNATVRPLSDAWWNAPHFFPAPGVVAFTENLLGLYPLSSPVLWATGNPILTYNLTLFLMWPLSGLAVYLLVRALGGSEGAAWLAGLAFAFSPLRAVAVPHIQTMATFGVPLCLLALHGYLRDRRWPWLLLFAAAWLHQGFANGYYILYGGLIVGLWFVYFCSTRTTARAALPVVATGALASLPLVPMLLTYRAVHDEIGIRRSLEEIIYFSAGPQSWLEVGELVRVWHGVLPAGKDNLFPGLTLVVLVVCALAWWLRRAEPAAAVGGWTWPRMGLAVMVVLCAALVAFVLWRGPIDTMIGSVPFRVRRLDRALLVLVLAGALLLWMSSRVRRAVTARSPGVFYAAGVVVFAVLACGPVLRVHGHTVLDPAPYGWLMWLPGFEELRVPTQIKMIWLLCLSVTAGVSLDVLRPARAGAARVLLAVAAVGVLLDGWLTAVPMAEPQALWAEVEPANRTEPILELPLGPAYDAGATLRAAIHRRRVMNGVSGYDPPHYVALKEGLAARDPALLAAVASLGPLDVVVDGAADADGALARYVTGAAGATRVGSDGVRTVYRLSKAASPAPLGAVLAVAGVWSSRNPGDAHLMQDGDPETGWTVVDPAPDWSVIVDLGREQEVGGVTVVSGRAFFDFARRLAIDLSADGDQWVPAWEGPAFAPTFLGFVRQARTGASLFPFAPRQARFVRLRRLDAASPAWHVAEVMVHAP